MFSHLQELEIETSKTSITITDEAEVNKYMSLDQTFSTIFSQRNTSYKMVLTVSLLELVDPEGKAPLEDV